MQLFHLLKKKTSSLAIAGHEAGDQISTTTILFTPFKFYMEW